MTGENRNMAKESDYKEALYTQLREATGRVIYTYTTYHKKVNRMEKHNHWLKYVQIGLSAISTSGFIGAIITSETWCTVVGGLFSVGLLALNLFFKDFNFNDQIKQYASAANDLWMIRENYISLLTDFCVMDIDDIKKRRNELQSSVYEVYKKYPKTDRKSYEEAQIALKSEEEQYFSEKEIDVMLPKHLRMSEKNRM